MQPLRTPFPLLPPLLLPLLLAALLAGCARDDRSTLEKVRERGVLVVGMEPAFPPFGSVNPQGEFVGIDVDLVRGLAEDLGVELRIEDMGFDALSAALLTGKIDVIASGMTRTEERARSLTFTDPYFHTTLCLLVHKDSPVRKPADLADATIAVKLGTTGEKTAEEDYETAEILRLDTDGSCANMVASGRADAFIYDKASILRHHEENPDTTRVILDPVSFEPYAMAVDHGDTVFAERINEYLAKIRADGTYEEIFRRHGEDPETQPR